MVTLGCMRIILLVLLTCWPFYSNALDEERGLNVGIEFGQDKTDFNYSSAIRETRLTRLGVVWYENLTPAIRGGVELGYLEFTQYSNPIPAGQTGGGEYIGLNLSFVLVNTARFELLTRFAYRYNDIRHKIDDQSVDSDWHEGRIGLYTKFKFSDSVAMSLGASGTAIDGREAATGPTTQAQPFDANEAISGHFGLQLGLDHAGTIGIEIDIGALQGGRLSFQRVF